MYGRVTGMAKGKTGLRLAKVGHKNMRQKMRPINLEPVVSGPRAERAEMYKSKRWDGVRRRHLHHEPFCAVCRRKGGHVDHLLGHGDGVVEAARMAGLPVVPNDWRARFWSGPFVTLCHACHSTKTTKEKNGRLLDWIADWRAGTLREQQR